MEYQTEPVTMWFDRRLVMRSSPRPSRCTTISITHVTPTCSMTWHGAILKLVKRLRSITPIVKHPPTIVSNHASVGHHFVEGL